MSAANRSDFSDSPLAVIGMACRLPGAEGLDEFWSLMIEGRSAVAELSPSRLDQRLYYDPEIGRIGKTYSKIGAALADRPLPSASYRLSRDDIENAEPAHLELCHVAAEAFRHATLDPHDPKTTRAGVYVGHYRGSALIGDLALRAWAGQSLECLRQTRFFEEITQEERDAWIREAADEVRRGLPCRRRGGGPFPESSEAARLVSKSFGLDGPAISLNAACSSTNVALAFGAYALQMGDIDLAVIGGASRFRPDGMILFSHAQTLSATGSRPFDADADGLAIAEGYVVVLVKTLARAVADKNPIHAVISGIGISSDGRGKSLWAPRREGQIAAVRRAYSPSVTPDTIQYIEAHATSTPVGDSTEINSLAEVFGGSLPPGRKIPIGSVKANIGHTLESAGLAGLIKTVLAMKHRLIPPIINLKTPNPKVDWENGPFSLPTSTTAWPDPPASGRRRAGVNAFGIGGLNVHVVVEEYSPGTTTSVRSPGIPPFAVSQQDRSLAVVGAAVLAPGARTIDAFWRLMMEGRDPKVAIPAERWNVARIGNEESMSWVGGFIQDYQYDWRTHRVPPKQVASADPLQFMILDTVEEALRTAGCQEKLNRERTSVLVGNIPWGEFHAQLQVGLRLPELRESVEKILRSKGVPPHRVAETSQEFAAAIVQCFPAMLDETGSFSSSSLASRVTKTYDLRGGACAIDGGDNSSIMVLDIARNLLLRGGCEMVICATGQRSLGPDVYEKLHLAGRLSPTGQVRPLDQSSDGLAPGEGVAVVLLKRYHDAEKDRDPILAVIREIGIARADDAQSAQARAISRALDRAGVKTEEVSAVETSASGVAGEDAAELAAIVAAYGGERKHPLHVRSLAGQIGHLGAAAGMMSLVKSAISLQHRESPACLPPRQPMAAFSEHSSCEPPAENRELPLVNSSGRVFSSLHSYSRGVACHVLLERAQAVERCESAPAPVADIKPVPGVDPGFRIWVHEGNTVSELLQAARKIADRHGDWRSQPPQKGARHGLAIVHRTPQELQQRAELFISLHAHPQRSRSFDAQGIFCLERGPRPLIAFLFPGQGSQYPGMLTGLVQEHSVASAAAARCDAALQALGLPTFRDLVADQADQLGSDLLRTQLSVLVVEAILVEVVSGLGIRPDRITGHSFGEFAALNAAGAWDFPTAAVATLHRCRLIAESTQVDGAMIACALNRTEAQQLCGEHAGELFVASCNTDDQTVIAGPRNAIRDLHARLGQLGVHATMLSVPRPFHTPLMAPVQQPFRECLRDLRIMPPSTPLLSSVDNRYVAEPDAIRENLVRQLVEPVYYPEQVRRLASEGVRVFVEIGPEQVLTRINQRIVGDDMLLIGTDSKQRSHQETLARLDAALHAAGVFASGLGPFEAAIRLSEVRSLGEGQLAPNPGVSVQLADLPEKASRKLAPLADSRQPLTSSDVPGDRQQGQQIEAISVPERPTRRVVHPVSERSTAPLDRSIAPGRPAAPPHDAPARGTGDGDAQSRPQPEFSSGLRVLTLSGTPFAMGAMHGQTLAREVRRTFQRYAELAQTRLGQGLPDLARAKSMIDRLLDESAMEEARGIAEGAGVSVESALEHNLYAYPDIGVGCTQLLARDHGAGERWLQAANEDMPLGLFLRDAMRRCVQVRRPTDGLAHILFSAAGQCCGINGVNSAGVAITSSMLLDMPRRCETLDGWLHGVLVRHVLETATTVETAVQALQRQRCSGGWGLCISDATGNDAAYVEYDGQTHRVRRVSHHQLVTNHAQLLPSLAAPPPHSMRRQERLDSLWRQDDAAGQLSVPTIQRWLRDQYDESRGRHVRYPTMNTIRRVDNQVSIVFDVRGARAWVTAGPNAGVDEDQFLELDLQKLIGLEVPSPSRRADRVPKALPRASTAGGSRVIPWEEFARLATSVDDHSPVDKSKKTSHRFLLRCVEQPAAPAADVAATLQGGALLVGDNAPADALSRRLRTAGVRCSHLRRLVDAAAAVAELDCVWKEGPLANLFLMTAFDSEALTTVDSQAWQERRQAGLMGPYQICQRWLTLLQQDGLLDQGRIVAGVRLGGLFGFDDSVESPEGGFATGLVKGLLMEQGFAAKSSFRACVVDFDSSSGPEFVATRLIDEAAAAGGLAAEIGYRQGKRHVVSAVNQPVEQLPLAGADYGKVWVVTGGARGITAKIALAIGQGLGVRLHLIGSSPLPQVDDGGRDLNAVELRNLRAEVTRAALERGEVPVHAWSQVEKGLEIAKNLRAFADSGLHVTYHACDVGNHAALARVLDQVRQQDGPIDGVVHGAGFERAASFPNKKLELVERTVAAKVGGAVSLMELTRGDPLKYFLAFGSISGRFGGVGQTDYCLANELLCKLVGWLRKTRPEVRATAIDWPSWDEVGMAVRPESKHVKTIAGASFMPVAEGIDHFVEEVRRGCPEAEVLVTDWRRYKQLVADRLLVTDESHVRKHDPTGLGSELVQSQSAPQSPMSGEEFALINDARDRRSVHSLTAEIELDPRNDPFLVQHRLHKRPVLPLVMILEAMAEAAFVLVPEKRLAGFSDVVATKALICYSERVVQARVRASVVDARVQCEFTSDFANTKGQLVSRDVRHAQAAVLFDDVPPSREIVRMTEPAAWQTAIYPERESLLYHGPVFRRLRRVAFDDSGLWAEIEVGPNAELGGQRRPDRWMYYPAVLDACFFACGIYYWLRHERAIILPSSLGDLRMMRLPRVSERCLARVLPRGIDHSQPPMTFARFDVTLYGADGAPIFEVHDYQAMASSGSGPRSTRPQ